MNAISLLHKIRTCDRKGSFTYTDMEMLSELAKMIQEAEAKAALAQRIADDELFIRCYGVTEWLVGEGKVSEKYPDPDELYLALGDRLGTDREWAELVE